MSLVERAQSSADRLDTIDYGVNPDDFVRYHADLADDAVAAVVRAVTADGYEGSDALRRTVGDGADNLLLFVQRRTLQARRQSSLSAVYEALDALALLPGIDDGTWETWVTAALYCTTPIGGDLESMANRFVSLASDRAARRFAVALDALERVTTLADCRIAEVSTSHGIGFLVNPELTDMPGFGLYAAPALGYRRVTFQPTSNVAQLAVLVADAIDARGGFATGPLVQDQLPATLLPAARGGPFVETSGCVRFMAERRVSDERRTPFLVYVAELADFEVDDDGFAYGDPDDASVEEIVESARDLEGQVAFADGQRLIVMSPEPSFDESDDEPIHLEQFTELIGEALADRSGR